MQLIVGLAVRNIEKRRASTRKRWRERYRNEPNFREAVLQRGRKSWRKRIQDADYRELCVLRTKRYRLRARIERLELQRSEAEKKLIAVARDIKRLSERFGNK